MLYSLIWYIALCIIYISLRNCRYIAYVVYMVLGKKRTGKKRTRNKRTGKKRTGKKRTRKKAHVEKNA